MYTVKFVTTNVLGRKQGVNFFRRKRCPCVVSVCVCVCHAGEGCTSTQPTVPAETLRGEE